MFWFFKKDLQPFIYYQNQINMEQNFIIDVDRVIASYNKNNPDSRQMNRKTLADLLGVNKQVFTDWKCGKTPKLIFRILKLMEIGKCKFEDFVVKPE